MPIQRSIQDIALEFLNEKILLLSGPRQVGKTFFSKNLIKNYNYLNFDFEADRDQIMKKDWSRENCELLILDEIHKMKKWKQFLKGIYDVEGINPKILVTGSSKLNTFKKAGDSLAGRHHSVRLNPLSIAEIDPGNARKVAENILNFGNFPEPFLKSNTRSTHLWQKSHLDVILRQDLIELENIREVKQIEILISLLASRVGGGISYANLAQTLMVSPPTVKKWIEILESFFIVFSIRPYSKNFSKSILKEPKVYFYDISRVKDPAAQLENFVAYHLLKRNQFLEDTEGKTLQLYYYRDKEKREVDFLIEDDQAISHIIEVKKSDDNLSLPLNYLKERIHPKHCLQLVFDLKREREVNKIKITDLSKFLSRLET